MIVAEKLGVPYRRHRRVALATPRSRRSVSTPTARGRASVGGTAVDLATDQVLAKARTIAAHQLETSEADLEYVDARVPREGHPARSMALAAIAFEAFTMHDLPDGMDPDLEGAGRRGTRRTSRSRSASTSRSSRSMRRPGASSCMRYVAVDDCGNQMNPLIVEGQIHGGIVQGVAQALWEEAVYDDAGQPAHASLLDYLVPSAAELPSFELDQTVTPSPIEPARCEGDRRGGDDRGDARGDQRGRRRAVTSRHHRHRRCPRRPNGCGRRSCTRGTTSE